jgi:hypothetical protein
MTDVHCRKPLCWQAEYVLQTPTTIIIIIITLEQVMKAQRGSIGIAILFFNLQGGLSKSRPCRFTPGKETQYPLYKRLEGIQCRSRLVWKISPPPRCDPRAFQPLASRHIRMVVMIITLLLLLLLLSAVVVVVLVVVV